ncbi:hypothetical protein [Paracidovorax citrulli]
MRRLSLLLSFVSVLLFGCGGDSDEPTNAAAQANGKAYLSAPLVGATVQVHDANGRPVATTGTAMTTSNGTFSFMLGDRGTGRMRVTVTGGTYEGKPFEGKLTLDVDGYDARRDLLYVNATTTMVGEYLLRHPGATLADANAKVYDFVGVPAGSRSAFILDNPHQKHFHHDVLLEEMSKAPGAPVLNRYLASLVDQMQAGTPQRKFIRSAAGGAAKTIEQIVETLTEHLGDELFAWGFESILTALGLGANSEILEQLHEINAKLDELKTMVSGLERDVAEAKVEIVNTPLVAAMTNISDQYNFLTWAAQHQACASSNAPADADCAAKGEQFKATIRNRVNDMLNSNNGMTANFALLKTSLAGLPTEKGALRRWHDYLKTTRQFYSPVTDPRLIQLNQYYQTYQLMAANLIVEAYVARQTADGKPDPDKASGAYYLAQLKDAIKAQQTLVSTLRAENEDVIEDQRNKLIWLRKPVTNFVLPERHHVPQNGSDWYSNTYGEQAYQTCKNFADSGYAGHRGWRVPTEGELHAVTKDSPGTGSAQRQDGVFAWLVEQGFQWAPGDGTHNQRGFFGQTAYYSSTGSGLYSWEALWDGGVDNACDTPGGCFGNTPVIAGVWCVTAGAAE